MNTALVRVFPLTVLLCFVYVGQACAEPLKGHFEVQGQAGWSYWSVEDSTMGVTSIIDADMHLKTEDEPTTFQGAMGGAYVWPKHCHAGCESFTWFPRETKIGLNFYGLSGTVKGDLWENQSPLSNNYRYDLDIDSLRLMLDSTFTLVAWKRWSGFAIAGMGVSWNGISLDSDPNAGIPADSGVDLEKHWDTSFTWEVGAGIEYNIMKHLDASLMYLYTDFGRIEAGSDADTGPGVQQDINPPEFDFSMQSILFGLSWAF